MALISLHAPLRTRLTARRQALQLLAPALIAALLVATGCAGESTPDAAATDEGQPDWLQARIEAIEAIYNLTPVGDRFLEEHDLRWMRGEPGWFGSFGYDGWTGVGESRLGPIMHELGHAYWGAFGVTGRPDLSWADPGGGHESSAIEQLHADLQTFIAQPPDPYEPLRERLRNLPKTKLGDSSGLLHFGEADLVHTTGGNALLLPPILRRYFDAYLTDGEFDSWYAALEWYQGLSPQDARLAAVYFGLEHLDFDLYRDLKPAARHVGARRVRRDCGTRGEAATGGLRPSVRRGHGVGVRGGQTHHAGAAVSARLPERQAGPAQALSRRPGRRGRRGALLRSTWSRCWPPLQSWTAS